ncbi:hypothetical protein SO802_031825 [Lithocarpus litseifolius]|uniref:CCHC-type domain-containing protein n=1 Tax=Lithocarpus litseifolius TaxID=425828 RepID=A0AAW2BLK3_9ROSI
MDAEVIHGLENMTLTVEEAEVIEIPDEGRREVIESCTLSLIGKFLTCKSFNRRAAKSVLRRAWGLENALQILEVGANMFQFKFQSEFDMNRVITGGPWTFDNQLLMLQHWQKRMNVGNIKWTHASLWVQIWGAPFDMVSPQVAQEVGSRLGIVEDVGRRRKQDDQNFFMRFRVALPIEKPLRRGSFIAGSNGIRSWVTFKYERLPMFCYFCGLLGHDLHHCPLHFVKKKEGVGVDYQYGDWLKLDGGRAKSPPKRSANPRRDAENEAEKDLRRTSDNTEVVVRLLATEEKSAEQMLSCHEEGKPVNYGIDLESQQHENIGIEPDLQRDNFARGEVTNDVGICTNKTNVELSRDDSTLSRVSSHVHQITSWASEGVGPHTSQTPGKWTRLNRMEFRLSGLSKAFNFPTLGKKGSNMETETDISFGQGERAEKRGRFNESLNCV